MDGIIESRLAGHGSDILNKNVESFVVVVVATVDVSYCCELAVRDSVGRFGGWTFSHFFRDEVGGLSIILVH